MMIPAGICWVVFVTVASYFTTIRRRPEHDIGTCDVARINVITFRKV